MGEYPINHSSWERAKQDTLNAQKTARFMWGGEGVLAVAGGAWLAQIAPSGASTIEIVSRSVIGGLGGLIVALLFILACNLVRAPGRQRDEARGLVEELRRPSDNDVDIVIQLLQEESLVMEHNNGEEQLYSFAEVFLAIESQLSIGIAFNIFFWERIKEALDVSEKQEWHIKDSQKEVPRLISFFTRYSLVTITVEEYEESEFIMGNLNAVVGAPRLVRSTKPKYYISVLGSRVAKQLRKQLNLDK